MNEDSTTRLLSHGTRTEQAVVLLHGLTSCPEQFATLGDRLFERGCNVLIPVMPFHGSTDRMTRDLNHLSGDGLRAYALEAVETARGLGERVSVMGFSTGGALAAWLAMECEDIHLAAAVAPILGIALLPEFAHPGCLRLMRYLPNLYLWWDPIRRGRSPYLTSFGYPGFPLHALRVIMRLGLEVYRAAEHRRPQARRVLFVLNGAEPAVNNAMARRVAEQWQRGAPGSVEVKTFARSLRLRHDYFAQNSENARSACSTLADWLVYYGVEVPPPGRL